MSDTDVPLVSMAANLTIGRNTLKEDATAV